MSRGWKQIGLGHGNLASDDDRERWLLPRGLDHYALWRHPSGRYLVTNEPYGTADVSIDEFLKFCAVNGKALNATARECGDNPNHWYVAEQPIDVRLLASVWTPRKGHRHRLQRNDRPPSVRSCKAAWAQDRARRRRGYVRLCDVVHQ